LPTTSSLCWRKSLDIFFTYLIVSDHLQGSHLMPLTAVTVTRHTALVNGISSGSAQIPRLLTSAAVAVDTNDNKGVAITQSSAQGAGPAALVAITGDAAWAWANTDSVPFASMSPVPLGVGFVLQSTPGQTQDFYIKTATTCNITVAIIG
jgi:hypothetical protein